MGEGPLRCRFCNGFSEDCPDLNGKPCCERCLAVGDGHDYNTSIALTPVSAGATTIEGFTVHGPDGIVAAFRRDEDGEMVEVDLEDAIVGAQIDVSTLRTRWLTVRDAEET